MISKAKNGNIIFFLVVILLAALYFSPSANHFLNTEDEGYLLYNFERVARGELPHRDFFDIYGALTHFLGGGLFKLFGTSLLAMRILIIILMAVMAGLIFLIGCRVMPPRFALLGSALFTIYWGTPAFPQVLYGNHCSHLLALLSIVCFVTYLDGWKKRWIVAAGFCAGSGILFKLPTGMFTLMALGLFLSFKEQFLETAQRDNQTGNNRTSLLVRISRLSKVALLIAVMVVFILYFSTFHLDLALFVIFLLPFFLFLGWMLARELSILREVDSGKSSARWVNFKEFLLELALLSAGPALLFLLQILFYSLVGGLQEMLYDTFALPATIDYYWPMDSPGLHTTLTLAVGASILIAVLAGRYLAGKGRMAKGIFFTAIFAAMLAPIAYVFIREMHEAVWNTRVSHVLSTTSLLVAFPFLLMLKEDSLKAVKVKLVLALCCIFSCLFLISSFPRIDTSHIVHSSTVIFVVVAFLLWKLDEGGKYVFGDKARTRRAALVFAACILIGSSFLWNFRLYFISRTIKPGYPRASSVNMRQTKGHIGLVKTIDFIREHTREDERIFVISERQLIYFLSERDTPIMKKNYFIFLSNFAFIDADSNVRLKDEQILEKLKEFKTRYVIEEPEGEKTRNFLRTWPRTAAYIQAAYTPVAQFEGIQILQLRGSRDTQGKHR